MEQVTLKKLDENFGWRAVNSKIGLPGRVKFLLGWESLDSPAALEITTSKGKTTRESTVGLLLEESLMMTD